MGNPTLRGRENLCSSSVLQKLELSCYSIQVPTDGNIDLSRAKQCSVTTSMTLGLLRIFWITLARFHKQCPKAASSNSGLTSWFLALDWLGRCPFSLQGFHCSFGNQGFLSS